MRIIALMNQKGGVGKTTTTVNLGAALAEMGLRVCLVDLDPQAHLTINYGLEPNPDIPSLYDVLVEERPFVDAVHMVQEGTIALVPSSIDLAASEVELVSVLGRETLLKRRIEAAKPDFDFILLDCPPSLGLLTLNALAVADEVIIPMQPHFFALQGVAKLLETVQLVGKRINPKLKVSGIVLTMFDSNTKLSNEVVAELNSFITAAKGKPLPWSNTVIFKSKIRRNIKLAESPSFGQTILTYEPQSNGAFDYRALAREVHAMTNPSAVPAAEPAVPAPPKLQRAPAPRIEPDVPAVPAAHTDAAVAAAPLVAPGTSVAAVSQGPSANDAGTVAPTSPALPSSPAIVEVPQRPTMEVTINAGINPAKLAAANVELPNPQSEIPKSRQVDAEAVA